MQDFVLIWRLYVVWGSRWHAVVLPVRFYGELHSKKCVSNFNYCLFYESYYLKLST